MAFFDLTTLSLGDVVVSGKGSKSAPIQSNGGQAVVLLEPMRVVFEPSAFGNEDASRVNIVFRPSPELLAGLEAFDEWVIATLAADSVRYFGRAKAAEQLRDAYTPAAKVSDKYPATRKAKMNIQDPNCVKVWDAEKQPRAQPQVWKDCLTVPRIRLRGLYFMGASFGAVLEMTDAQIVEEQTVECPF